VLSTQLTRLAVNDHVTVWLGYEPQLVSFLESTHHTIRYSLLHIAPVACVLQVVAMEGLFPAVNIMFKPAPVDEAAELAHLVGSLSIT
jgi:hypothetical protein